MAVKKSKENSKTKTNYNKQINIAMLGAEVILGTKNLGR